MSNLIDDSAQDRTLAWLNRKTPGCPSLVALDRAALKGVPEQYKDHIDGCEYCQRTLGIAYGEECPTLLTLAEYLGLGWNKRAVDYHLEQGCEFCYRRLAGEQLQRLAAALRSPSIAERAIQFLKGCFGGFLNVPDWDPAPDFGAGHNDRNPSERAETILGPNRTKVIATVREQDLTISIPMLATPDLQGVLRIGHEEVAPVTVVDGTAYIKVSRDRVKSNRIRIEFTPGGEDF